MRSDASRRLVVAPGQGENARTCRTIASAGCVQSMRPSDFVRRPARVAWLASWGWGATSPAIQAGIVSISSVAPISARRSPRLPASSSSRIGSTRVATMSPVSSPSSTSMIVTPLSRSPARRAAVTGEAPRQRGKIDACTLSVPKRGGDSTAGRRICP